MKTRTYSLIALLIVIIFGVVIFTNRHATAPAATTEASKTTKSQPSKTSSFDTSQHSLTDPTSIWVVVNKIRPLQPKTYAPDDLVIPNITLRSNITSEERQVRKINSDALKSMADAAKQEGITLTLESGYRGYNFQVNLYNRYVSEQGQSVADTQSARPGFSEHQTGLAADLGSLSKPSCNVEQCYADTVEGKWLAANAYKYGYIIRYPNGKDSVTGYEYEPWHVRYVGIELSTEMHNKGIQTLEEFFHLPAAPDYK
jgi:D-alanyl-D-alanine carboxypeptidase